jgi:hypothetical protein
MTPPISHSTLHCAHHARPNPLIACSLDAHTSHLHSLKRSTLHLNLKPRRHPLLCQFTSCAKIPVGPQATTQHRPFVDSSKSRARSGIPDVSHISTCLTYPCTCDTRSANPLAMHSSSLSPCTPTSGLLPKTPPLLSILIRHHQHIIYT